MPHPIPAGFGHQAPIRIFPKNTRSGGIFLKVHRLLPGSNHAKYGPSGTNDVRAAPYPKEENGKIARTLQVT
jgi:hypothetical protein